MVDHWPLKLGQSPLATVILGAKSLVYTIWYSCVQQLHRLKREAAPAASHHDEIGSTQVSRLRSRLFASIQVLGIESPKSSSSSITWRADLENRLLGWTTIEPPQRGAWMLQCSVLQNAGAPCSFLFSSESRVSQIFDPSLALQLW